MVNRFNEVEWAEALIKSGFININNKRKDLRVLSKYYFYSGYNEREVSDLLVEYCNKYFIDFNIVVHRNLIRDMVKYGKKNDIIYIPYIRIYKSEIDYIKKLKLHKNSATILFTLLVLNRIYKQIYDSDYINDTYSQIGKLSTVKTPKVYLEVIRDLESRGYIGVNIMSKIKFLLDIPNENIDITEYVDVKDYSQIGLYYQNAVKIRRAIECVECGSMSVTKSSTTKYCRPCAKIIRAKQEATRMRTKYQKLKEIR